LWLLAQDYVKDYRAGRGGFYTWWFEQEFRRFDWQRGRRESLGCGAGRTLFCVAWDGFVFPCHRFSTEARDGEFCGGHVHDYLAGKEGGFGPAVQQKLQRAWEKQRPPQCAECIGQYGCQGNCYHANWKTTGDMLLPSPVYCTFKREAARCVQWIDNQLRAIDPQWWKRRGACPARTRSGPRLPITSGAALAETPAGQISGG
jgi:radical SAM protein with 4Fe4S-binding SPASM domain